MQRIIIIILSATLLGSCATTGRFRNLFEDDIAQNRENIKFGSLPQTISDLSMLLEMDPKNEEARFLRALAYQKSEAFEKAIDDYSLLLKNNPNHSKARYNLAMIFAFKMHDSREALKQFDQFISLSPNDSKTFAVAKIMISLDEQQKKNRPASLNKIIEEVLADQGISRLSTEEDIQKRKKILADAIKTSPDSAELYFAMGQTLAQDGKIDEAIKSYENALSLHPTYAECHYHLGQLLLKTKRKDEGQIHLIKASLFKPNETH